jgi:DNA-binding LytR/AlgR family response regulator
MTFTCIIIDDDPGTIDQLTEYISLIPELSLLKGFTNPMLAVEEINSSVQPLDFLFTDIEMPEISGIEVARLVGNKIKSLILVSSHLKYAVEGYDLSAKQFLPKPFNFKKFQLTVNKLIENLIKERPFLWIKVGKKNEFIRTNVDQIIAFEGASNYIKIHTVDKTIITYGKIYEFERILEQYNGFIRINKSFIISEAYIEKIENNTVHLTKNIMVKIGATFKKSFSIHLEKITRSK